MTIQTGNLGTAPSGAGGDTFRSFATKMNENFTNPEHAASKLVGTSGAKVPLMNAVNTWVPQVISDNYPAIRYEVQNMQAGVVGRWNTLECSNAGTTSSIYLARRSSQDEKLIMCSNSIIHHA